MKIASVIASGAGQPEAGRFSADSIEASDIEIDASIARVRRAGTSPTRCRGSW